MNTSRLPSGVSSKGRGQTVSSEVVRYLISSGYTPKQLSEILEVDISYISHVVRGSRNLIVTDLERLAREERLTLPELLAKATPVDSVPEELREGYKIFLKAINEAERARAALPRKPKTRRAAAG